MNIQLTPGEAQALFDLVDRECRVGGAQAAATFGPVVRQMIEAAQAAQKPETPVEEETDNG